jgi:hypothetical protein
MLLMKRHLLAAVCLMLAVLCLASIIAWARSYVSAEAIAANRRFERYAIIGNDGCIALTYGRLVFDSPEAEQVWRSGIDPGVNIDRWNIAILHELNQIPSAEKQYFGFGVQHWDYPMTRRGTISGVSLVRSLVQFPFWVATLLTGIWPAAWLWKLSRLRHGRVERGLCRKCGFDLAGVYYSCPKCGQRIPLPGFEPAPKLPLRAFEVVAATPASPSASTISSDAGVAATSQRF